MLPFRIILTETKYNLISMFHIFVIYLYSLYYRKRNLFKVDLKVACEDKKFFA